jgi:hypothetical protein
MLIVGGFQIQSLNLASKILGFLTNNIYSYKYSTLITLIEADPVANMVCLLQM